MTTPSQEERAWHVDANDQPIGDGWQLRDGATNWQNYRAINVFIKNHEGKLWIPRRTKYKRAFPECLDMSVSGYVDWPETYDEACAREMREELNLDASTLTLTNLGYVGPQQIPELSAFMQVYEIQMNESPRYNPDDFTGAEWLSPDELRARILNGEKTKGDLPHLLNHFYPAQT